MRGGNAVYLRRKTRRALTAIFPNYKKVPSSPIKNQPVKQFLENDSILDERPQPEIRLGRFCWVISHLYQHPCK